MADRHGVNVVEELGLEGGSEEQHMPIIDASANDEETMAFPDVPNDGIIDSLPEGVMVEIPAKIDGRGIHSERIEPDIPERIKKMYLRPRILKMEWALEAFTTGDRKVLEEVLVKDPRTQSFEQVKSVWNDILDLPFNEEKREHYEGGDG